MTTDELVDSFAAALKEKLRAADKKYRWNDGWKDPVNVPAMKRSLRSHIAKGDPRDVAAYCAFLWYHGEGTQ